MTGISIEATQKGKYVLLTINGPINSYTFTEMQEKVMKHAGKTDLAIDLSGVTSMTSAGIGVVLAAIEDAEADGKRIIVVAPSEVARLAIESTGFAERFPTVAHVRDLPA